MVDLREPHLSESRRVVINPPPNIVGIGPAAMFTLVVLLICVLGYMVYAFTGRSLTGDHGGTTIIERHNLSDEDRSTKSPAGSDSE